VIGNEGRRRVKGGDGAGGEAGSGGLDFKA
jgi:hypothetical protein